MAVFATLIPVEALARMLRISIEPTDEYAQLIIGQASNTVRDYARQAGWVRLTDGSTPGVNQTEVPVSAQDITLWLAMRAYTNPRNLERRTAGPISETFRDTGVYGLELTDDEKARLGRMSPAGGTGLWVQPLDYGEPVTPIFVPSQNANGTVDLGYTYLADSDQFPYNVEP